MIIEKTKNNKYKPTNDYMFSRVFGDSDCREILKNFLQSILTDIQIVSIDSVKQAHLDAVTIKKKFSRMDILATLNNNIKVNIEMQMDNNYNTIDRSLYYAEKLSIKDLEAKQDYTDIPKTIGIWILDYNLFEEDAPFHEITRLRRDYNYKILTDKLEMHYILLPKFKKKCKHISSALEQWLTFIINDDLEEIKNMDNELIQNAESKLELLNNDEKAREIAEMLIDAERNERSALANARQEGHAEGRAEGHAEGIAQEKIEVVKKMLEKNLNIDLIVDITGINKEEILEIKNSL